MCQHLFQNIPPTFLVLYHADYLHVKFQEENKGFNIPYNAVILHSVKTIIEEMIYLH